MLLNLFILDFKENAKEQTGEIVSLVGRIPQFVENRVDKMISVVSIQVFHHLNEEFQNFLIRHFPLVTVSFDDILRPVNHDVTDNYNG